MSDTEQTDTKFILDAMLGSLARWLRFLGYDTWYCATQSDDEILEHIAGRVLLTRDKELIRRAEHRGHFALNPGYLSIRRMLEKLREELNITFVADPLRSRCPECNSPLEVVNRSEVNDKVPSGTLRRHHTFWQCINVNCQKIYWQGRHWTRIKKTLAQLGTE
jgi:uncharacterized protein with PIN domain